MRARGNGKTPQNTILENFNIQSKRHLFAEECEIWRDNEAQARIDRHKEAER
jgi:hypothetical protein